MQVEWEELLQDTVECLDTAYEDYEDNHFLSAKVKEELGGFLDWKDEAKRICGVFLFVSVHNANPDEAMERTEWNNQQDLKGDGTPWERLVGIHSARCT
jgi:hypothetical protein